MNEILIETDDAFKNNVKMLPVNEEYRRLVVYLPLFKCDYKSHTSFLGLGFLLKIRNLKNEHVS